MSHDTPGNTDPQRGAKDADAVKKGGKSFLDNFSGLSEALSNDENGFSNKEGFNTDRGHEPLADTNLEKSPADQVKLKPDFDDLSSDKRERRYDSET